MLLGPGGVPGQPGEKRVPLRAAGGVPGGIGMYLAAAQLGVRRVERRTHGWTQQRLHPKSMLRFV